MTFKDSLEHGIFSDPDSLAKILGVDRIRIIYNDDIKKDPLNQNINIIIAKHDRDLCVHFARIALEHLSEDDAINTLRMRINHEFSHSDSIIASTDFSIGSKIGPAIRFADTLTSPYPEPISFNQDEIIKNIFIRLCPTDYVITVSSKDIFIETPGGKFKLNKFKLIDTFIMSGIFEAYEEEDS